MPGSVDEDEKEEGQGREGVLDLSCPDALRRGSGMPLYEGEGNRQEGQPK